jgi:type III secretion system YscQ/HrcQ family protein
VPLPCGKTGPVFFLRPDAAGVEFPGKWDFGSEIEARQTDFTLEADGENWKIRVWGLAAEALLAPPDVLKDELNVEDIPAELKPALLALTLEPLLDRASQALGHVFRLALPHPWSQEDGARPKDSGPENSANESFILPFTLTDNTGNPAGAGLALIPLSAAALSALTDMIKLFPRRPAADCSALPLSLSLCVARESFPVKILREAEPGDVLRFSCPAKPALTLEVYGRTLWTVSLANKKITIEGVLNKNPEEAAMSATLENAGTPAAKDKAPGLSPGLSQEDINALEITLNLELDERRITIGELAALGPGQILDTTASLEAPVTIKAGGKAVGKGRLVEVGDNLGVLIASLELNAPDGGKSSA